MAAWGLQERGRNYLLQSTSVECVTEELAGSGSRFEGQENQTPAPTGRNRPLTLEGKSLLQPDPVRREKKPKVIRTSWVEAMWERTPFSEPDNRVLGSL